MMTALAPTPLVSPVPDGIPLLLRQARRWAPWRAAWNSAKGKYEKIPHRAARPEYGLSNKGQAGWCSFEEALAAYQTNIDGPPLLNREGERIVFGGVGYLMTGPHGVSGIDLDHCVKDGVVDPWAREIAAKFDSYTELSPSGTGLHIMIAETVPSDWMNHEVQLGPLGRMMGIEVYGGHEGRFLCVTGVRVPGTCAEMQPLRVAALETVEKRHRKAKTKAEVEDLHLPELTPVELLPSIDTLELPPHARNFLTDGPRKGDRSGELFACAIALSEAGLKPDEILSVLEANEHAMEVALDHRRQDYDKALRFLWKEAAQRGTARAGDFKQARFDEFEDVDFAEAGIPASPEQATRPAPQAIDSVDVFDDLDASDHQQVAAPEDNRHVDLKPLKKRRFESESVSEFLNRSAPSWIVKKVVPRAGLAVIYGNSDAGKTFFTLDLVGAIARGVEWRGLRVKKGRVLYVVAEGTGGFRNRLKAYCEFHGVDPASLDIRLLKQTPNLLEKEDIREFLQEALAAGKFDVIVLDTYARAMAGANENDAKDAGQAVAHCDAIHRKTGALVVLIHHSGKDASKGARGSGALRAAADLEIEVVRTREYRAATITKQKDGADGAEYQFKLGEVVLGEDEDGEPITSCVIDHLKEPIKKLDASLKGHSATVYSAVSTLIDLGGDLTYAAAIDAAVLQIPHDETKRDRRRDLVVRALQDLESKNLLSIKGGLLYLQ